MVTLQGGVQQNSGQVPTTNGSPIVPVSDSGFIQNFYGGALPPSGGINTYYTPIQQTDNRSATANLSIDNSQAPMSLGDVNFGSLTPSGSSDLPFIQGAYGQMPNMADFIQGVPKPQSGTGGIGIGGKQYSPQQLLAQYQDPNQPQSDGGGGYQQQPQFMPQQQSPLMAQQPMMDNGMSPLGPATGDPTPQHNPYQNLEPVSEVWSPELDQAKERNRKLMNRQLSVRKQYEQMHIPQAMPDHRGQGGWRGMLEAVAGGGNRYYDMNKNRMHAGQYDYIAKMEKIKADGMANADQELTKLSNESLRGASSRAEKAWDLGFKIVKEINEKGLTPNQSANLQKFILGEPASSPSRQALIDSIKRHSGGKFDYTDMINEPQLVQQEFNQRAKEQQYQYYKSINPGRVDQSAIKTDSDRFKLEQEKKFSPLERATKLMKEARALKKEDTEFIDQQVVQANNMLKNYNFLGKQLNDMSMLLPGVDRSKWNAEQVGWYNQFLWLSKKLPEVNEILGTAQERRMQAQYGQDPYQEEIGKMVNTPAPGVAKGGATRMAKSPAPQNRTAPPPPPYMAPMPLMGGPEYLPQQGMNAPAPTAQRGAGLDGTYAPPPPMMGGAQMGSSMPPQSPMYAPQRGLSGVNVPQPGQVRRLGTYGQSVPYANAPGYSGPKGGPEPNFDYQLTHMSDADKERLRRRLRTR